MMGIFVQTAALPLCAMFAAQTQPAAPTQDDDLARLPKAIPATSSADHDEPSDVSALRQRVYVDTALSALAERSNPAFGFDTGDGIAGRVDLDMVYGWKLGNGFSATFSDRVSWAGVNYAHSPTDSDVVNSLREAYVSWSSQTSAYLDVGRINLRNGVALGWNPTDYFKTGTSIPQTSADPTALRDNRLGTVVAHAQYLWDHGSFGIAVAPKLADSARIDEPGHSTADPYFDRTNDHNRYLLTAGFEFADLSPQFLVYEEAGRPHLGINISRPIGDAVVAYAEWSGSREYGLAERAAMFARETELPFGTLAPLPGQSAGAHYRNDAAVGASWVIAHKLTLNLEYHYHGSGLSADELRSGYDAALTEPSTFGNQWWYLRQYAVDRQEPLARRQWFVRVAADDVFTRNLSLSAFAFVDAYDGSTFAQIEAEYHLSDKVSLGVLASRASGGRRSEYGAVPSAGTVTFQLVKYL